MGTRGAIGVRIDGVDKVAYNHFDSYPDGLGADLVKSIWEWAKDGREEMCRKARALKVIDTKVPPTAEEQARFAHIADLGVSEKSLADWYCLLRTVQGSLTGYIDLGVIPDSHTFLADSLFCEWAYIVNLDEFTFEVYRGFQDAAHSKGRYATLPICDEERRKAQDRIYHPVALIATYPLNDIPHDWVKRVEALTSDGDDE